MGRLKLPEQVVHEVQRILVKVCKETHGMDKISGDKINNISKLLNSYTSLLDATKHDANNKPAMTLEEMFEHGEPGFYERMAGVE